MNKSCPWCDSDKAQLHLKLNDYFLTQEPFEIWECLECGLLYTHPRPDPCKIADYYKSDEYYSHRENKHGIIPKIYEAVKSINLKNKVVLATNGFEKGKLLDIGCGVADFINQVEAKGWEAIGIEPSSEAIAIAKQRVKANIYQPNDLEQLPDESFDVITMWHVLEHVDNIKWEIAQLQRLLRKGGRLVIALPNFKSYDAMFYREKWAAYDVPRHLNHFCKDTLVNMLSINKLKFIKLDKLSWDAYYISFMSEKYRQQRLPFLRGLCRGWLSNLNAKKTGEWSSLVYVFEK